MMCLFECLHLQSRQPYKLATCVTIFQSSLQEDPGSFRRRGQELGQGQELVLPHQQARPRHPQEVEPRKRI